MSIEFSDSERETLARLADVLIPAGSTMPSASQAGVATTLLDAVLGARPDVAEELRRVLGWAHDLEPEAAITRLRSEDDAGFQTLTFVVAGGYLMDVRVGGLLGYPGQEAKLVDPLDYMSYVEEGLLDPVIARGAVYRDPRKASASEAQ